MHANSDTLSFEMPKCETPKQNSEGYMVEESLRKLHGGGIMELESRGRNHGGGKIVTCVCVGVEGIMEETVERMSHGGGTFEMQSSEYSWGSNCECSCIPMPSTMYTNDSSEKLQTARY